MLDLLLIEWVVTKMKPYSNMGLELELRGLKLLFKTIIHPHPMFSDLLLYF